MGKRNKSLAKASGLKSTFINGNEVTMTSFGKGNSAVLEKKIVNTSVQNLNPGNAFAVVNNNVAKGKVEIRSKRMSVQATADNPVHSAPGRTVNFNAGQDIIGCKDAFETRYFGKTFDDNIHIQLIYNILDIEKILAVHVTNAAFALNNVIRAEGTENEDFIGYLSACNTYDEFVNYESNEEFSEKIKENLKRSNEFFEIIKNGNRLGYFGPAFYYKKGKDFEKKTDKEIFDILALIGSLRQFVVHDLTMLQEKTRSRSWLYNIDSEINEEFIGTMDKLYNDAVKNIDRDFIETNKVDLHIIYDALKLMNGSANWQRIAEDYYRFTIEKTHKNTGFSIKRIREIILGSYATRLEDKTYDSVRHKLNKIIDFLIFSSYDENTISKNVSVLRTCLNDEEKETKFYIPESKRIWNSMKYVFENFIPKNLKGKAISDLKKSDFSRIRINIENIKISKKTPDNFSKIIYLLTMFLDGKEINDLLTTLINKFDNIASFINVMDEMNLECNFTDEYRFFEKSAAVCSDLRLINSFARMTSPVSLAKAEMYREAIEILGTRGMTQEDKKSLINKILCIDENGEYIKKDDKSRDSNLRNFIANNVIESSRFKYLIRYNNAKKTRTLASNKTVVQFLLHRIDKLNEKQIDRYYETCRSDKDAVLTNKEAKINYLADMIMKIDCSQFLNVKNKVKSGSDEALEKERLKAVIGLYLTIMYIITKNMVYVNSRYVIAFHCLERDCVLHDIKNGTREYCALIDKFLEPQNKDKYALGRNWRALNYMRDNRARIAKKYIEDYRNAIAHLSVVRNMDNYIDDIGYIENYFALYHYIMQRYLFNIRPVTPESLDFMKTYSENLANHETYCKDFVKALNVPFGYNLARYKNLSIAELFDKNETAGTSLN